MDSALPNPRDKESPNAHKEPIKKPTEGFWAGSLDSQGRFFCDCEPPVRARCLTTRNGKNAGKKFWKCPKPRDEQCGFFIWVDQEATAKEWLANHGRLAPETPSGKDNGEGPSNQKPPDTPWTLAKRKPISREASDEQAKDGGETYISDDAGGESPSRKSVKRHLSASPGGQTVNEHIMNVMTGLPTPQTNDTSGKGKERMPAFELASRAPPTPAQLNIIDLTAETEPDLTTTVLDLVREEGIRLKESTTLQIRHEIELEAELNVVKQRKLEETILRAWERLDELEDIIMQLTGASSLNT